MRAAPFFIPRAYSIVRDALSVVHEHTGTHTRTHVRMCVRACVRSVRVRGGDVIYIYLYIDVVYMYIYLYTRTHTHTQTQRERWAALSSRGGASVHVGAERTNCSDRVWESRLLHPCRRRTAAAPHHGQQADDRWVDRRPRRRGGGRSSRISASSSSSRSSAGLLARGSRLSSTSSLAVGAKASEAAASSRDVRSLANASSFATLTEGERARWLHNKDSAECMSCRRTFHTFLRRHHCRGCGNLFCGKCSSFSIPLPHRGYDSPVRACRSCASPLVVHVSSIPTVGGEMLITAHNIGQHVPGSEKGLEIEVEGCPCTAVRVLSAGPPARLRCSVQSGVGCDKELLIRTANGLESTVHFSYDAPSVQHCTRPPTSGGEMVITGINFGRNKRDVRVFIGSGGEIQVPRGFAGGGRHRTSTSASRIAALAAVSADTANASTEDLINMGYRELSAVHLLREHKAIRCHVPAGVGHHIPVIVRVAEQQGAGIFSYAPPKVAHASTVPSSGGTLRITGTNLGAQVHADDISVRIIFVLGGGSGAVNSAPSGVAIQDVAEGEAPQLGGPATNVRVLRDHAEIACEVPAFPALVHTPQGSGLGNSAERTAQVIVSVADQEAPPELFQYMAPVPSAGIGDVRTGPSPSAGSMGELDPDAVGFGGIGAGTPLRGGHAGSAVPSGGGPDDFTPERAATLEKHVSPPPSAEREHASMHALGASLNTSWHRGRQPPSVSGGPQGARALSLQLDMDAVVSPYEAGSPVRDNWTPDNASNTCLICGSDFTFFRRRHHCRRCGNLVCGNCSANTARVDNSETLVRVCDTCYTLEQLRANQDRYIQESQTLMALLPPEEGAEFRQAMVYALAAGARECAERVARRMGLHPQQQLQQRRLQVAPRISPQRSQSAWPAAQSSPQRRVAATQREAPRGAGESKRPVEWHPPPRVPRVNAVAAGVASSGPTLTQSNDGSAQKRTHRGGSRGSVQSGWGSSISIDSEIVRPSVLLDVRGFDEE